MKELLSLLENNPKLTPEQLAVMLDKEVGDIKNMIKTCENDGIIVGYRTMIDWDKTETEYVSALIELKVSPQKEKGFDRIAEKIRSYDEVKSLYLMSGGFDLAVFIEGKTLKQVAFFVAQKLAPLDAIVSTATHFILKKYKDNGINYSTPEIDERGFEI